MPYVVTSNELTHYGILGQKWGVRRFQNADRTWTEEGKIRYGKSSNSSNQKEKKLTRKQKKLASYHPDYLKVHDKKRVYELSDQELRDRVNRLNMEKNYNQLTEAERKKAKTIFKNAIKEGKSINEAIDTTGKLVNVGKNVAIPLLMAVAGAAGLSNILGFKLPFLDMPMGSGGYFH